MDIALARTFLMVAETGSFIDAARRMNVTQSTVSARVRSLETLLGRQLFERSKLGAALTLAGEQFQKHALALVRAWQHAQLEVGMSGQHDDHLSVGAEHSLWPGLLIRWVGAMRTSMPNLAISASSSEPSGLIQRLLDGTLDLAIMYRPIQSPGLLVEHIFDEELVLVSSVRSSGRRRSDDYVLIDWGPDFQEDHAAAYPRLVKARVNLDLGPLGLDYLLNSDSSGYLPWRLVRTHVRRGRLKLVARARRFVVPVAMVYPESRDEATFEPILESLRQRAMRLE